MNTAAAGVVAIAATYIYFLLYAQFGFVSYLKLFFRDPLYTEQSMGFMGLGGLLFSVVTAMLLRRVDSRRLLLVALAGCAAAALLTLTYVSSTVLFTAAFFIGGFAGMTTVTLASGLKQWIRGGNFGLLVGLGTGLAYLTCNIPAVFDASPMTQTLLSAAVCLVGWCAIWWSRPESHAMASVAAVRPRGEFAGVGFVAVVIMFLSLVWLDSTAFATIQLTENLRAHTWGTPGMKLTLGVVHALAAVATGWLIDRGYLKGLLFGTFLLFVAAFSMLQSNTGASWFSGPLYAIGISVYSTALVAFPSLHPEARGLVPVRWRAAILYAVAGWIGSGLGVGLAQHLHTIPVWLLLASGALLLPGWLLATDRSRLAPIGRYAALMLVAIGGSVYFSASAPGLVNRNQPPSVELGREVYKQEGCINCHSQYLRPNSKDIVWWGPYRGIDRAEKPPMVGNRRQGPDLMNAGIRRTEVWHRQHLIDPTSLSPGSKMPSYAFLFRAGDPRGESLVLYLASLGRSNFVERAEIIRAWTPAGDLARGSAENGRHQFDRYCTMCHGMDGRGDGVLAPLVFRPAMNLTKGPFVYVPAGTTGDDLTVSLARIVKFGLPGLHMPGHETWSDQTILDTVAYVKTLPASGTDL